MELYSGEWTEIKGIIEFFPEFYDLGVDTSKIIRLFNLDQLIPATGAAAVSLEFDLHIMRYICELAIGLTAVTYYVKGLCLYILAIYSLCIHWSCTHTGVWISVNYRICFYCCGLHNDDNCSPQRTEQLLCHQQGVV